MEERPKRDKRIAGIKQSYVTGCFIIVIILIVLLTLLFLYGYVGGESAG